MSVYRQPPPRLTQAPRAPWWRILRAWATGSLSRLPEATDRRDREIRRRVFGPWIVNGVNIDKDRAEQRRLGMLPYPKGEGPRPVNIPE